MMTRPFVIDNGEGIRAEVTETVSGAFAVEWSVILGGREKRGRGGSNHFTRKEAVNAAVAVVLRVEEEFASAFGTMENLISE